MRDAGIPKTKTAIAHAISSPAKALFTHAGKPTVYVQTKSDYRRVEVQVKARNPDEVAVTGLPAGSLVALVDVGQAGPTAGQASRTESNK